MYVPPHFREDRIEVLHAAMTSIGAATLVGQGPDGLIASHVPIELDPAPAPFGRIRCHLARANPQARAIGDGQEVLLIFQGPQSYITPSWYPSKHQTGKAVPTWNYVAIHAYGRAATITDQDRLLAHLAALTTRQEARYAVPWQVDDAPADYIAMMCRAIVGIEIEIARIDGKWKLSQNRAEHDRAGVVNGLRAQGDEASRTMAALMQAAAPNG